MKNNTVWNLSTLALQAVSIRFWPNVAFWAVVSIFALSLTVALVDEFKNAAKLG